jgi:hypothetical protein
MKIASTIARVLLGVVYLVFGLNGFLNFIPPQPMPPVAIQFVGALIESHYMMVVFAIELACGVLFLANRYVILALTVIAPVIFNILLVHIFMAPAGLPIAIFVAILWVLAVWPVRSVYSGIFQAKPAV